MINADGGGENDTLATTAIQELTTRGLTIATAESLTGGLVCAALTAVPGASAVVHGGVVAYATAAKRSLLGVAEDIVAEHGSVAAETAAAMAGGVRYRLGTDLGLATTGVAGPDRVDGHPAGTVHVALAWQSGTEIRSFTGDDRLPGDRAAVREATVGAALRLLTGVLD